MAAIPVNRMALRFPRDERRHMIRQSVGAHVFEEGPREKVPANFIAMYQSITAQTLVANNPRVMLSTIRKEFKSIVKAMQVWENQELVKLRAKDIFQRAVVDALYGPIGCVKVALAKPADAAASAWGLRAGKPFMDPIDFDDIVFDMHARTFEELSFVGHRLRVPLDPVKDSKIYQRHRKDLQPMTDKAFNAQGDERVSMIGRSYYDTSGEEFEDHIDLWEIYLPRHRVVATFAAGESGDPEVCADGEPLLVQGWLGPDSGPYHFLGFEIAPGNLFGPGPVAHVVDLHDAMNNTLRKLMRTTMRLKENTLVQGGGDEDADRLVKAMDGEMIPVDNPENFQQVLQSGQAMEKLTGAFQLFFDLANRQAGNLELAGGLGPQSKTATQDKLLNQNAGAQSADKQDKVVTFVSECVQAHLWYAHHDPHLVIEAEEAVKGVPDVKIHRKATPQQRANVPFEQMAVMVNPYSLQFQTPESKLAKISEIVQQVIVPMSPLLLQSGRQLDIELYLQIISDLLDLPELTQLVNIGEPVNQGGGMSTGGQSQPQMPAQTSRTYNRINSSEATPQGQRQNQIAQMMTGKSQGGSPNGQPAGAR